jgi:hypothetical protein
MKHHSETPHRFQSNALMELTNELLRTMLPQATNKNNFLVSEARLQPDLIMNGNLVAEMEGIPFGALDFNSEGKKISAMLFRFFNLAPLD